MKKVYILVIKNQFALLGVINFYFLIYNIDLTERTSDKIKKTLKFKFIHFLYIYLSNIKFFKMHRYYIVFFFFLKLVNMSSYRTIG